MPKLTYTNIAGPSAALSWAGAWASGTDYKKNQQTANDGDLFVCLENHTSAAGNEPGTGASWETYWARSVDMLTADQIAAATGTGTPSGSNKFVTADYLAANRIAAQTFPSGAFGFTSIQSFPLKAGEVIKTATGDLTVAECCNTVISNYGQDAAMTLTLPTAEAGLSFIFIVTTTGYAIHLKAGASDKIYLDGVALDDADKVSCATPAAGNCIAFFTWKSGASTYDWIALTQAGVWADGGA